MLIFLMNGLMVTLLACGPEGEGALAWPSCRRCRRAEGSLPGASCCCAGLLASHLTLSPCLRAASTCI